MLNGKITSVIFPDGKIKHPDLIGTNVTFDENITVGKPMLILKGKGYISTSNVEKIERSANKVVIHTLNSTYCIENVS